MTYKAHIFFIVFIGSIIFFNQIQCKKEYKYVNLHGGLSFRDKPSIRSKQIDLIPNGTKLQILDKEGDIIKINGKKGSWIKVKYNKKPGWVFGGFLMSR